MIKIDHFPSTPYMQESYYIYDYSDLTNYLSFTYYNESPKDYTIVKYFENSKLDTSEKVTENFITYLNSKLRKDDLNRSFVLVKKEVDGWIKEFAKGICYLHNWQDYVGFRDAYRFCTKCNTKEYKK